MNNMILDINENRKLFPKGSRIKILVCDGPVFVRPGEHATVMRISDSAAVVAKVADGREVPLYPGRDAFIKLHN